MSGQHARDRSAASITAAIEKLFADMPSRDATRRYAGRLQLERYLAGTAESSSVWLAFAS